MHTASCSQILAGDDALPSPPKIPSKSLHLHRAMSHCTKTHPQGGNQKHFPLPVPGCANISVSGEAAAPPVPLNNQLHTHHTPGWESRVGQHHRVCVLLKFPTNMPLGNLLSAELQAHKHTPGILESLQAAESVIMDFEAHTLSFCCKNFPRQKNP